MKKMILVSSVFTAVFIIWCVIRIANAVSFDLECKAYLQRAAAANTVELAKPELAKAIEYAEQNNLTSGIVSIFLKNPTNDIGFWYGNMKASYEELDKIADDATALEKTNVLMKLRETLTDRDSSGGTKITVPEGIAIYPNNVVYFWLCIFTVAGICVFGTWLLVIAGKKGYLEGKIKVNTVEFNKKQ